MTDLVTVSIAVSRAEALVVASMLEGYGIRVHIGGDRQGSTEYWSLAYGGYRLWISEDDHEAASEIIRQSGALEQSELRKGPRPALVRFIAVWLAIKLALFFAAGASATETAPPYVLPAIVLESFMIPVNPQGRADYFLTPEP